MNLIATKSFQIATISAGDSNAPRLALILPGRLDTKDYLHMRSHVEYLGSKGFYALSFDPPGTWESQGDISLYTVPSYLQAIHEIIEYFGNRPTVVMGHSRGGSMAMLAGVQIPAITHIITAMSHYGPSPMDEEAQRTGIHISYRDLPENPNGAVKKRFNLPLAYFEDPTKWIGLDTCPKPKLMFYGTRDILVTPAAVHETYELAAEPKELHALQSDHDYRRYPAIVDEVNEVVGRFLDLV